MEAKIMSLEEYNQFTLLNEKLREKPPVLILVTGMTAQRDADVAYFQQVIDKLGNPYEYGSNGRDHSRSAGFENCRQQLKEALK